MASIPRETIVTTLALLGIGLVLVITLLIFAFSILGGAGGLGGETGTPTRAPGSQYATPTPEYEPNTIYEQPLTSPTPVPTQATTPFCVFLRKTYLVRS
jgi:hypothetical protein